MNIRALQKSDIPHAVRIVTRNYAGTYGEEAKSELEAVFIPGPYSPCCVVAENNGKILGFACFTQSAMDFSVYEIFWVNVDPDHQQQGVGKLLIDHIITEMKERNKSLSPEEEPALLIQISARTDLISYYQKHFGFRVIESFSKGSQNLMVLSLED